MSLYISDENTDGELLSPEEFKDNKKILLAEKNNIKRKIENLHKDADLWLELTEKTYEFATYAKHWFYKGSPEEKTTILRALGTNFILKDKKLSIDVHPALKSISKGKKELETLSPTVELASLRFNKAKTAQNRAVFNIVSRVGNDVRTFCDIHSSLALFIL